MASASEHPDRCDCWFCLHAQVTLLTAERDEARAERDLILCHDHTGAGRRFDIKCVICRWDAAEQDAARLAEEVQEYRTLCIRLNLRAKEASANATLAAHEERVGGER